MLAKAMHRDGLLIRRRNDLTANLSAFPKPKSQEKGALIADLRLLNAMMVPRPRPFELPSMAQLTALLELLRAQNSRAPFTKFDVSNMFWSVPPSPPKSLPLASASACKELLAPSPASPLGGQLVPPWQSKCWLPTSRSTFRAK